MTPAGRMFVLVDHACGTDPRAWWAFATAAAARCSPTDRTAFDAFERDLRVILRGRFAQAFDAPDDDALTERVADALLECVGGCPYYCE